MTIRYSLRCGHSLIPAYWRICVWASKWHAPANRSVRNVQPHIYPKYLTRNIKTRRHHRNTIATMPPPQKRRWGGAHSSGTSKRTNPTSSTQSNLRISRTPASRRSSGSSSRAQSCRTTSRDASQRPALSATARTCPADERSTAAAEDLSEAPQDEYSDVEMLSEVIMAVTLTDRGAIGCAYYVARNETLYFMEDVQMGDASMVDSCK